MNIKSYQSKLNNAQGKHFERLIEQACTYYMRQGIALIEKTPEPFTVTKLLGYGKFEGRFIGKAQPDFKGTLKNGQAMVFEAKHTTQTKMSQSVVSKNQAKLLNMHELLGAKVGVCCMINKTVGFVDWATWDSMLGKYGRKYITEEELREFEIPTPGFADFLGVTSDAAF